MGFFPTLFDCFFSESYAKLRLLPLTWPSMFSFTGRNGCHRETRTQFISWEQRPPCLFAFPTAFRSLRNFPSGRQQTLCRLGPGCSGGCLSTSTISVSVLVHCLSMTTGYAVLIRTPAPGLRNSIDIRLRPEADLSDAKAEPA